jgi:hypothetical protein
MLENLSETTLVAWVVVASGILLEIFSFLIDSVIGEVHVQVAEVAADRRHVFRSREPSEALMVYENPQRRDRCEQNIDPQIKFKPINEVRLVKVALGNIVLIWLDPVVVASEEDAFSLTTVFGFNYKCLSPTFVKLLLELLDVAGQNPRIRKEVVILREVLLHSEQVAR